MKKQTLKQDKAVAGLTILLSLIVMLFVIGLLVMIFSIMGGKIMDTDTAYVRTGTVTVGQEAIVPTTAGTLVTVGSNRGVVCSIGTVYNGTTQILTAPNYTASGCSLANKTGAYTTWKVNYTYTYLADLSGAVATINDTTSSIATTTDWFDIFIVIGAMVVLILLTVLIITSIRGSGMISGGQSGANNVGTA